MAEKLRNPHTPPIALLYNDLRKLRSGRQISSAFGIREFQSPLLRRDTRDTGSRSTLMNSLVRQLVQTDGSVERGTRSAPNSQQKNISHNGDLAVY